MRGNWCKNCNSFVEIKKDYTVTMICGIIYLIAIVIGLGVFFPLGGLIALVGTPVVYCCMVVEAGSGAGVTGRNVCITCGKGVRRKKIP